MRIIPLSIVVAAFLLVAAPLAQGRSTIIGQDPLWQGLVNEALVTTPEERITVVSAPCPTWPGHDGCWNAATRTIWIHPVYAAYHEKVFLHELGHAFDTLALGPAARQRFQARLGRVGEPWLTDHGDQAAPGEIFASVYSLCARYRNGQIRQMEPRYFRGAQSVQGINRKGAVTTCRMLRAGL